ncbi:MAG: hypothetical protein ACUVX9_18205, partial [Anaerolineae bacterium]
AGFRSIGAELSRRIVDAPRTSVKTRIPVDVGSAHGVYWSRLEGVSMTLAMVCQNDNGLLLASDSQVLRERDDGHMERATVRRVYGLGTHAGAIAFGDVLAVELCAQLAQWLQARNALDQDDTLAISREFLAAGLTQHLREQAEKGQPAPRHLAFVIGGCSPGGAGSCRAVLLRSEGGELPFQEAELGRVFTLPRRLVLEGRIMRRLAEGASLSELAVYCRLALQEAAVRNHESVGGPFDLLLVTPEGVRAAELPPQ